MNNKIGIHTFNTSFDISEIIYDDILRQLFEYASVNKCRLIPDKKELTKKQIRRFLNIADKIDNDWNYNRSWTLDLRQRGLNIVLQEMAIFDKEHKRNKDIKPVKFVNYCIRYIVNPAQIMGGDYYNIYTENHFIDVCNRIDEITASVCELLPSMHDIYLRRIDFCRDITLDSQKHIDTYIEILQKYQKHKRFRLLWLPAGNNRRVLPMGSMTLQRGATMLYIYDKFYEMWSKRSHYPAEDIFKSEGILRLELRIYNDKIYYEKKKRGLENTLDFLNESMKLARHFFGYYLKILFCEGDYYSYDRANEIIENSRHTEKTKAKLKTLLECISDRHSINGGINAMIECGYKAYQINYAINQLNELNVNPVTISRRTNIEYLPNLLRYINAMD